MLGNDDSQYIEEEVKRMEEEKRKADYSELTDYITGEIIKADQSFSKRVMIGMPTTGLVRIEWVMSRYAQVIPCNWSQVETIQWLNSQITPLGFLVADARNIIVERFITQGFEWLMFIDHDVVIPPFTFVAFNERIIKGDVPVFSGLYFTKSIPAEPLVYRGRGNGYYAKWKMGDEVWVDGLPMGCTVIHRSILEEVWNESEEYLCDIIKTRRVFETPVNIWYNPEESKWFGSTGTEDLKWCSRVMENDIFKKTGWDDYVDKEFPFLIDTQVFCRHIDQMGITYPSGGEENRFKDKEK
jgi:hypothetical protein